MGAYFELAVHLAKQKNTRFSERPCLKNKVEVESKKTDSINLYPLHAHERMNVPWAHTEGHQQQCRCVVCVKYREKYGSADRCVNNPS